MDVMIESSSACISENSFIPVDYFRVSFNCFSFYRQYFEIYSARFLESKQHLIKQAMRKWNATLSPNKKLSAPCIYSLSEINHSEKCVIIGIVYKEMRLKPSILRDLASTETINAGLNIQNDSEDKNAKAAGSFMSLDDRIYLEDDVQRITLVFSGAHSSGYLNSTRLATGIAMAVLGHEPETEPGSFIVDDVLFLDPQPKNPIRLTSMALTPIINTSRDPHTCTEFRTTGPWLAVLSGLGFTGIGSSIASGHAMALTLLADWLRCSGDFSSDEENESPDALGIVRLFILGDSIRVSSGAITSDSCCTPAMRLAQQARYLTRHMEAESVTAMSRLDTWLASLPLGSGPSNHLNGLPIDLLPGPADPTSQLLPQQPMHAAALPLAVARAGGPGHGGICGRTNPYSCRLYGRNVLATSGQGVNDLARYTNIEEPCDRMEATLHWGHLAPTCPDTLAGYPLLTKDPLLLHNHNEKPKSDETSPVNDDDYHCNAYPDIYLAGCQPISATRWKRASLEADSGGDANGALLVAVPRFDVSFTLTLVHLKQLVCRTVRFNADSIDTAPS